MNYVHSFINNIEKNIPMNKITPPPNGEHCENVEMNKEYIDNNDIF